MSAFSVANLAISVCHLMFTPIAVVIAFVVPLRWGAWGFLGILLPLMILVDVIVWLLVYRAVKESEG